MPIDQTKKNLFSNVITLITNIVLGLFFTPYLVKCLGIVAYGIVPLAFIINQYITVLTGSLTGALTRFYSVAIQQGKIRDATKYINTALTSIIILILSLLPFTYFIISYIDKIFTIPSRYISNAKLLFLFTLLSFFLSLISSLYNVTLFALNRLDLMNLIKILRQLLKIALTISFFMLLNKNIEYIGISYFISEFLVLILSIYYFYKTTDKKIKIGFSYFDKTKLIIVLGMTLWTTLHQIGDTGIYRIDNVLVNIFFGTKESGVLSALSEFGNFIINIVSVFSSLFGPLILIAYAKDDHDEVLRIVNINTLLVGILGSSLVGLLVGFSHPITELWLGKCFSGYSDWLIYKLIPLPFVLAGGMFAYVFRSWNRVKIPAIITVLTGLINLCIMFFLLKINNGQNRFISVALCLSDFLIIIQSYLFGIWYMKRIYNDLKYKIYLRITCFIVITIFIFSLLGRLYLLFFLSSINVLNLFIGLCIVFIVGLSIIIGTLLKKEEINYLFKIVAKLK